MSNRRSAHFPDPHKYHAILIAGQRVWACALPNCTHYMPKHMETMMPGKESQCWNCDDKFLLDHEALKNDMPFCLKCRMSDNPLMEYITRPQAP